MQISSQNNFYAYVYTVKLDVYLFVVLGPINAM